MENQAPGQQEKWDAGLQDLETCVAHAKKGLVKGSPEYQKCIADIGVRDPRFIDAINDARERMALTASWQAAAASEERAVYCASADETRVTRKSFGSITIIVPNTGHCIQFDSPQVVVSQGR